MAEYDDDDIQEPKESAEWLDLIEGAQAHFASYLDSCDYIDKLYSDLSNQRSGIRDQDMELFWSNIQIMAPSVYARPPQPVVTPKFRDRRPVYRVASEMLERVATVAFDQADINGVMLQCRDDLVINGRGVAWVRYEDGDSGKRVCIEHIDRRDFLHEPARKWADVSWVARRGWLSKSEMVERFGRETAELVSYQMRDDRWDHDRTRKCGVWEIWHRGEDRVVWVAEGVDAVLDDDAPHLKVDGFFPCPQPAYATVQRRSLIPVADVLYYKGQLEQINSLTARIHALGNALRMKGFYQGGGEIGDAVEAAMAENDDGRTMVPVSSMAAFGSGGEPIVWMPIDQVATTLTALVELRRQLIEDIYQIIGLSDIMRGATQAEETLGAQQIKQQNGSYRIRDKQNELVRLARDLVRISAEIIAENFDRKSLVEMAQMDIPTRAEIKKQVKPLEDQARDINRQIEEADKDPQIAQAMEQNPEAVQQALQAAQEQLSQIAQQIDKIQSQPTIEDVLDFLKDEKLRPFVLDIETDSTIYPDEMREKASRAEFMQVFTSVMAGVSQLASLGPQALGLSGAVMKFALAPYRVGRELEGVIDDFIDAAPQISEKMAGEQGEEAGIAEAQKALADAEMAKAQAQTQKVQADAQLKMQELELRTAEAQAKSQQAEQKFALEVQEAEGKIAKTQADIERIQAEIMLAVQKLQLEGRREDREDARAEADIALRASAEDRADRQQVITATSNITRGF